MRGLNQIFRLVFPVAAPVFALRLVGGTAWTQSGAEAAIAHSEGSAFLDRKWIVS
jgi:hypothetical protein